MTVAIVGASETTELGRIPDLSQLQLHADAALNAMADARIKPSDIDGVATAGASPTEIAHYLGIEPRWADGTSVGGCSFMLHVRHPVEQVDQDHQGQHAFRCPEQWPRCLGLVREEGRAGTVSVTAV